MMPISELYKLRFPDVTSLGDAVAGIYLLENIGRFHKIKFQICLPESLHQLFDVMDLLFVGQGDADIPITQWQTKIGHHFLPNFLSYLRVKFGNDWHCSSLAKSDWCPILDVVLGQFDSRNALRNNRKIYNFRLITRLLGYEQVVLIGGPDSKIYESHECRYGDIAYIVDELMKAELFIGCDSGISHLAGALGIPSIVIPLDSYNLLSPVYREYSDTMLFNVDELVSGMFL